MQQTSKSDEPAVGRGAAGYAAIKRAIIRHLYQKMGPEHRDGIVVTAAAETGATYAEVQDAIDRLARHGIIKWRGSGYVVVRPAA